MKNNAPIKTNDWLEFVSLCQKVEGDKQWQEFLDLITTPAERQAITLRYLIIKELIKGDKTQRAIAKEVATSVAKITRGSNYLKGISKQLLNFLHNNVK